MRNVLRFKTTTDISRPLQTGFWLSRDPCLEMWVSLKYERLQDCYCFNVAL
ncbi:hypothetical protein AHAS_Ahas07G0051200 [Arachis hypogaea]